MPHSRGPALKCGLHCHPSDSDAGWNSTQHPTWPPALPIWPPALSQEFDLAVSNWWMGLWFLGVSRYWGKSFKSFNILWPPQGMSHLFSCDQAALWMVQSVRLAVRLSVRLSVRHTFSTMFPSSHHHEIFRSCYQWQKWRPCKRSRSEVKGQGHWGQQPT